MDHAAQVDQAAANVLAHHEILMASPAASKLNAFYPNPSESECTIAQAVCNSGQLFIQANSKNIGGSSDFMVSTPNIMDCPQLLMQLTIDPIPVEAVAAGVTVDQRTRTRLGTTHDGWGFDAIERMEVSFANSNISNLQIQGHAMRDWSLLQCKNQEEREQMLKIAGKFETWTRESPHTISACIPLSFLFFRGAGGVKGGFGLDGRVLNGPITFQFHFRPINYIITPVATIYDRGTINTTNPSYERGGNGGALPASYPSSTLPVGLPTAFSKLELTMRTYQLMDGTFSVSKALEANPALIYSIPALWLNTYSQDVVIGSDGTGSLNINSVPAGMVQAIIMRIRPVNQTSYITGYTVGDNDDVDANRINDYQSKLNYDPSPFNDTVFRGQAAAAPAGYQSGVTPVYRPYVPWSLDLEELKLEYSGQAIYWAKTKESHDCFTRSIFNDDLKTNVCGLPLTLSAVGQKELLNYQDRDSYTSGGAATDAQTSNFKSTQLFNLGDAAAVDHETQVTVIPLMHDGDSIFRRRGFENLPHYSGSTLQLTFKSRKNNTYRSKGLDRIQCQANGQLFGNPDNYLEMPEASDRYVSTDALQKPTYRSELDTTNCASYPSNRLQHVAGARPPRQSVVEFNEAGNAALTVQNNQERVIFNNNPTAEGAVAFTTPGGGLARVELTYVIAALFQVTNGVAELQL